MAFLQHLPLSSLLVLVTLGSIQWIVYKLLNLDPTTDDNTKTLILENLLRYIMIWEVGRKSSCSFPGPAHRGFACEARGGRTSTRQPDNGEHTCF